MTTPLTPVVFLLDVDNTLLDNDRIIADLNRYLMQAFGEQRHQRYWKIFEERRVKYGYADYLGTLQRYRLENPHDPHLLRLSFFFVDYPFFKRLFPHTLKVIKHLDTLGTTVILSDGDMVFQPCKIQNSGLFEAVDGRVLIYVHKEREFDNVESLYPACHYVMVDDKPSILTAMKKISGARLTTVFVRQGHYASDSTALAEYLPADITIEHIDELLKFDLTLLLPPHKAQATRHKVRR